VAIVRNHIGALKKIGATVVYDGGGRATLKLTKGKAETWVGIGADADYEYRLDIVEKGGMVQDVVASADALAQDLTTTGRAALYGLFFDTGKAVVKAASEASLKEIATLLGRDPALKLFVVGHTDNVGAVASNLALSKARAEAVVQALTTRHGVGAGRLAAFGVGPLSPVATNLTEAGRALNRRVELTVQ
jgi:outer membrane protein OmpA-like peptidoglycan-associated protein